MDVDEDWPILNLSFTKYVENIFCFDTLNEQKWQLYIFFFYFKFILKYNLDLKNKKKKHTKKQLQQASVKIKFSCLPVK